MVRDRETINPVLDSALQKLTNLAKSFKKGLKNCKKYRPV
jgi:hypothetical protein